MATGIVQPSTALSAFAFMKDGHLLQVMSPSVSPTAPGPPQKFVKERSRVSYTAGWQFDAKPNEQLVTPTS